MNASEQIDQRIAELGDWRGDIFARLRKLILETDPEIAEEWKWDTGVWSHNGNVCAVGVFKNDVRLNLFQGAALDDPHGLFNTGLEAKKSRGVSFRKGDSIDEAALRELIRAAVEHNRPAR